MFISEIWPKTVQFVQVRACLTTTNSKKFEPSVAKNVCRIWRRRPLRSFSTVTPTVEYLSWLYSIMSWGRCGFSRPESVYLFMTSMDKGELPVKFCLNFAGWLILPMRTHEGTYLCEITTISLVNRIKMTWLFFNGVYNYKLNAIYW